MNKATFKEIIKYHKCLNCGLNIDVDLNFCSDKCKQEDIKRGFIL